MASQKISQLPAALTSLAADLYPLVQSGVNFSITFSRLQSAILAATTSSQLPTITLIGDVTGTAAGGSIVTTVGLVGGVTAANVATSTVAYLAATALNTPSTLVERDSSGNFAAGTINGILVENHHARHQPGSGLDELPTAAAAALTPNLANAVGISTSLARADHVHNVATAAPSSQTPDQANADGIAVTFSKSDHTHNIPTAAAISLTTASANARGSSASFARADHMHSVTVNNQQVVAVAGSTTTALTDTLITGMTITPVAGTYLVLFNSSVVNSANGAQRTFVSAYFNSAQLTNSEIAIGTSGGAYSPVTVQDIFIADGINAIEIRARVAAGTSTWYEMAMTLIKLSN